MEDKDKVKYVKVSLMTGVYRITLPKKMAKQLGIDAGDYIKVTMADDNKSLKIEKVNA